MEEDGIWPELLVAQPLGNQRTWESLQQPYDPGPIFFDYLRHAGSDTR
jgi:hypothetical protein